MKNLPSKSQEKSAGCLKALAHPVRLAILHVLKDGEKNVQEIMEVCGTSQPNISQHLRLMKDKGILLCKRRANQVYYKVANPKVLKLVEIASELSCKV